MVLILGAKMKKILIVLMILSTGVVLAHHERILVGYYCITFCIKVQNPISGKWVYKDSTGVAAQPIYIIKRHNVYKA